MPRLNMLLIGLTAIVSVVCYHRVDRSRDGLFVAEAMEIIETKGLKEIERQQLFNAALEGMVSKLDRFSTFVPRERKEEVEQRLENHFPGIGIRIRPTENEETGVLEIFIRDTVIGTPTPAHDAGLRSGDQIIEVDGVPLTTEGSLTDLENPLIDAHDRITGTAGTPVAVTVLRDGERMTLDVTRQEIDVATIFGDTREADGEWDFNLAADPRITYIRIESFSERTAADIRAAIEQRDSPTQALVLDVRNNPGGFLHSAIDVCNMFVDRSRYSGLIVSTRNRDNDNPFLASNAGTLSGFPMVVLANGESASASEIVSGCLQDHQRAVICGTRTFGKGSVQAILPTERGRSLLKLTTHTFWRPSNQQIHKMNDATDDDDWGIRPSEGFEVPLTDEEETRRLTERIERDAPPIGNESDSATRDAETAESPFDPQLQRAVEYLHTELEKNSK